MPKLRANLHHQQQQQQQYRKQQHQHHQQSLLKVRQFAIAQVPVSLCGLKAIGNATPATRQQQQQQQRQLQRQLDSHPRPSPKWANKKPFTATP